MNNRKMLFTGLIVVFLCQLCVPLYMIYNQNRILKNGKKFKFECVPVDPTDPFRGKYVRLAHKAQTVVTKNKIDWKSGDKIFVILKEDKNGFTQITSVSTVAPVDHPNYLKASIDYVSKTEKKGELILNIDLPFDRYYMNETAAPRAEEEYTETVTNKSAKAYTEVSVLNGEAVIKNLYFNDTPINEYLSKL